MTTPAERYADLLGGDDPALERLIGHLDRALQAQPAPDAVVSAIDRALAQRSAPTQSPLARVAGTLSRRDALKAGVASMAWLFSLSHVTPAIARELDRMAAEGPMTGARFAGILRTERARWNTLLAQVGPERMEVPGVEGAWSVKEIIAHLTWYEGRVVEGAQRVMGTGVFELSREGLAALTMDERNDAIAAEARARPVGAVLSEAEATFGELMGLTAAIPDELLNDAQALGLPDDIPPWMRVANNSYAHYREHEESVRAWLSRTSSSEA
jgi:hypothetical protein